MTAIRIVNVRGVNKPEERSQVVYCGRPFTGWKGHPLGNPFKPSYQTFDTDTREECAGERARGIRSCLDRYRAWLLARPTLEADLAALWEETGHGAKPLGCWCVNAVAGDGSPVVCHAQIIGEMLRERFQNTEGRT